MENAVPVQHRRHPVVWKRWTLSRYAWLCAALPLATLAFHLPLEPVFADVQQARLFQAGEGGYHTYRIPALLVTAKGTVLAFCEGRKNGQGDSGDIDLLLRRSVDGGRSWGPVQTVVDDGDKTCGNPCPILDRNTGRIVLLATKNNGNESEHEILLGHAAPRTAWVTTSDDDGVTWSPSLEISGEVRKRDWRWYATGPCHGIQLKDGRLVAPCDYAEGPEPSQIHSHVIFSDDGGVHWQLGGVLDGRTDESSVVELADGSLYINMRTCRGTHRRAYAVSKDRGVTWSSVADDDTLVEPQCQGSVIRFSAEENGGKGRILFSNPASVRRENMTVRLSYDECKTWPIAKSIWKGPAASSDLAVLADKRLACFFEAGEKNPYETITLALFPLEWLTEEEK
jgi:sialidase-1